MTDPNHPVQASILVVPNGGDENTLYLSLRVVPTRPGASEDVSRLPPPIDLDTWPDQVASLAAQKKFRVDVAPIVDATTLDLNRKVTVSTYAAHDFSGMATGAADLWSRAFPAAALQALYNALRDPDGVEPGLASAGPLLAPQFDVDLLCETLIRTRSEALESRLDRLLDGPDGRVASSGPAMPASLDASMTELEAWAGAAGATGALLKQREHVLKRSRTQHVKAAIIEALKGHKGGSPAWRQADSYAMLEALHLAERFQGKVDARLAAAVAACAPTDPAERLASRMESLMLAASLATQATAPAAGEVTGENERRKLAAILSYPTVSKYLGMAFDLRVPRTEWNAKVQGNGTATTGAVAVSFGTDGIGAHTAWSAYLDFKPSGKDQRPAYFGPRDISETGGAQASNQQFVHGMLNLGATYVDRGEASPRYALQTINPVHNALQQSNYAREVLEAFMAGRPIDDDPPELTSRGIALLDKDVVGERQRTIARDAALPGLPTKLLFASDLLIGYRPAVGIALRDKEGLEVPAARWRSLVARNVTFGAPIGPASDPEREHGHTRGMIGHTSGQILAPQEIFVWTGDSLGVPPPGETGSQVMETTATEDLPLDITYSLPRAGSGMELPPLREGRSYVFGMSAVFVNGCGPTLAEAIRAHTASTAHLLGSADRLAYRFARGERVPPPVVLLRAGTQIVTAAKMDRLWGESLTTMVIRDGGPAEQRYLFPERVEFDRAEQQDMFGRNDMDVPYGALRQAGITRSVSGGFPRAIGGRIDPDAPAPPPAPPPPPPPGSPPAPPPAQAPAEESRGPVIRFDDTYVSTGHREYYPDFQSRGVWTRLAPVVPANGVVAPMKSAVAYREAGQAVTETRPVMLELKAGRTGTRNRAWIDPNDKLSPDRLDGKRLDKIAIAIEPGTVIDVSLDSDFDPQAIARTHLLGGRIGNQGGARSRNASATASRIAAALPKGRIKELQGATKLRLVHAVQKPLAPPEDNGISPILVTVAAEDHGDAKTKTWRQIMSDNAGHAFETWSQEGGAVCFFAGKVSLDGPSTGTLSLDATWEDWGPEMAQRRAAGWSQVRPLQVARLFTMPDVASDTDQNTPRGKDKIDLLGPVAKPHHLSFTFRDGRARELKTRLTAVSRFIEYYDREGATATVPGATGTCELQSVGESKWWIPCTFRPPPLEIKRVTPWFHYKTTGKPKDQVFTFSRRTSYRVEIGRQGFLSGQDERVGLVFDAKARRVCDYLDDEGLKPFASGVTRWGSDPIHQSGVPATNVLPDRFAGYVVPSLPRKLMPGADPIEGQISNAAPLDVNVLGYKLEFDGETGNFYCDIGLNQSGDNADAYMPFVQLGLVRYQPKCVAGLELSLPVGCTVQLLPSRFGNVKFKSKGEGKRFSFTLSGPVDSRNPRCSLIDITALLRVDDGREHPHWVPQVFPSGRIARETGLSPDPRSNQWFVQEFTMATSRLYEGNHAGLLVEEYEMVPDREGNMHRRLLFGHIVDFGANEPPFPART